MTLPINYQVDVATPFESVLKGYAGGAAIRDDQLKQQQQQTALAQQQQMQRDMGALASNPNPTAQDYVGVMTKYPQFSEHFKRSWDVLSSAQQQSELNFRGQVYSALQGGQEGIAEKLLRDRSAAKRGSGLEEQAKADETMAEMIKLDPKRSRFSVGTWLGVAPGGDKILEAATKVGAEQRAQDQAPADLAKKQADAKEAGVKASVSEATQVDQVAKVSIENQNVLSQIQERAKRSALDQDRLTSETQIKLQEMGQKAGTLDDSAKKIINESTVGSVAADQSASQMFSLADRLQQEGVRAGVTAKGTELYKQITGNQDGITALRQEYTRLRSSSVLKMLPPGPASDKDIAFAMKGFPDETSDANMMSSFLRGMGKIQQREAIAESAKAEWANAVGHMGKTKTDITIEGVKVPAGSTFPDFAKQFFTRKTTQLSTAEVVKSLAERYAPAAKGGAK